MLVLILMRADATEIKQKKVYADDDDAGDSDSDSMAWQLQPNRWAARKNLESIFWSSKKTPTPNANILAVKNGQFQIDDGVRNVDGGGV